MNKKIIYLSLFLVLALFLISSCQSSIKGAKIVTDEDNEIVPVNIPETAYESNYYCEALYMENMGGSIEFYTSELMMGKCVNAMTSSYSCEMVSRICYSKGIIQSRGTPYVSPNLEPGQRRLITTRFYLEPIAGSNAQTP